MARGSLLRCGKPSNRRRSAYPHTGRAQARTRKPTLQRRRELMATRRLSDTDDWLSNAGEGLSRRQFLAGVGVTGASLAGFGIAANPVAAQVITTPTDGLTVTETKVD